MIRSSLVSSFFHLVEVSGEDDSILGRPHKDEASE
jgi:hypothetical protein